MTHDDRPKFAGLIAALAETFGKEITDSRADSYWLGLSDLPLPDVEHGFRRAILECEFMPPPAVLRRMCGVVDAKARGVMAWESVLEAVRRVGGYAPVRFDDPATGHAIRALGGWEWLTGLGSDELMTYTRQAFLAAYGAYANRPGLEAVTLEGMATGDAVRSVGAPYLSPGPAVPALGPRDDEFWEASDDD